tara:strand:- start:434 stop:3436 length:3003 start_codon:yes stop_codon:yes gene_type:complete
MARVSPIQNNFNGGEISPLLYGRPDVDRYKTGLKTCLNFIPLVQGPVERRPGTVFIKEVKTSSAKTRIVRFEFSTTQAYILEFGNLYVRFYKDNGVIRTTGSTISGATKANPVVITDTAHPYANGDELFIQGVVGMTELNDKYYRIANKAANTYQLQDIGGTNIDGTGFTAYSSAGTAENTVELATTYTTAQLFQLKFAQSADILYIVHPDQKPRKISRTSDVNWSITDITFSDGPFLPTNSEETTLLLSGTSGSVTVTATDPTTAAITGATAAKPVVITDVAHGFSSGDTIFIAAVGGMVELNNIFYHLTKINDDSYSLQDTSDVDIDGTGFTSYTSGGTAAQHTNGINGQDGFKSTDVGRLIRWEDAAGEWTFLTITAVANARTCTAFIDGPDASATTATTSWRLGVWSDTTGYPGAITFHQNRLVFAGPRDLPQRIDMSRTGDFENFAPTEVDATVVDDNAVTDNLSADTVNAIRWVADDEKGLLSGTVGGEWVTRPSDTGGITTPANVQSKRSSGFGSANIAPIRAGRAMLFIQRALKKVRELAYVFEDDGFKAPDLTLISEHISRSGIVEMAYQGEPQSLVWIVLVDGTLICMTYERDQKVVGWSRHKIGGVSDAGTKQAMVESVATIPNPAGAADELYMVVRRRVNGATVRYIEYLKPHWDDSKDQEDAFFVDSGLSLDSPLTITGITQADPAVVTIASHTFTDGDDIRISNVLGMTEVNKVSYVVGEDNGSNTFELFSNTRQPTTITAITKANPAAVTAPAHGLTSGDEVGIFDVLGMTELNGNGYVATVVDANNITLAVNSTGFTTYTVSGTIRHAIDSSAFGAYVSGGEARERSTVISGLDHLEGETVHILAEGSTHATKTVSSGSITLDRPAAKAHIGLQCIADLQTLRRDEGSREGTSQGKFIRFHRVLIRFLTSLGGFAGPDEDNLDEIVFREGGDPMDTAVPLFTGDVEIEWDGDYSNDSLFFYRQTQPLPVTIEAFMPQMETQDRS